MKLITDRDLEQIKDRARKLFSESSGSIYKPIERDRLLFQALNDWLVQQGVACDWRLKD